MTHQSATAPIQNGQGPQPQGDVLFEQNAGSMDPGTAVRQPPQPTQQQVMPIPPPQPRNANQNTFEQQPRDTMGGFVNPAANDALDSAFSSFYGMQ